jgi:hypothetical protein
MRYLLRTITLCLVLTSAPTTFAQQADITVGNVKTPSLRWGKQIVLIPLTNSTDYLKYVVIETKIIFQGAYLHPQRVDRINYVLKPTGTDTVRAPIDIPGSFGEANMTVTAYDVVDTLDVILPYQKFFEQPFSLHFHIPDALAPYLQEKITLPPMVESNPDFDNEFSRALIVLLSEGKSIPQIAEMAMADTSFVRSFIESMNMKAYVKQDTSGIKLQFPLINSKEAEEGRLLANKVSAELAAIIQKNLPELPKCRDSLIAAGKMTKDSNGFMEPGALLFRPYPVVAALLLWGELGERFITDTIPLEIFKGSDPCNAYTPSYIYAVQGGDIVNGSQFYHMTVVTRRRVIWYGDSIPQMSCPQPLYYLQSLPPGAGWNYSQEYRPEAFMFDSSVTNPAIRSLGRGSERLLQQLADDFGVLASKYRNGKSSPATRYWFWNMVATKTLKELVTAGAVTRLGNGQYKLEGMK